LECRLRTHPAHCLTFCRKNSEHCRWRRAELFGGDRQRSRVTVERVHRLRKRLEWSVAPHAEPERIPVPEQQRGQDRYDEADASHRRDDTVTSAMAIPALMMAMLFPVIGAIAVFLLLRGHDLPGGGFVAGVTMAVAFILQYMARGTTWVEARLRVLPVRWMGFGLLLAVSVGAASWLFDRPFLSSSFSYIYVPLIGPLPLASALLFDIGVFALVVGATVLMLIAIAHQSVRSHRAPTGRAAAPRPTAEVK